MNVSALMMWKTIGLVCSSLSLKSEFRFEVLVVVLTIHEYENNHKESRDDICTM